MFNNKNHQVFLKDRKLLSVNSQKLELISELLNNIYNEVDLSIGIAKLSDIIKFLNPTNDESTIKIDEEISNLIDDINILLAKKDITLKKVELQELTKRIHIKIIERKK